MPVLRLGRDDVQLFLFVRCAPSRPVLGKILMVHVKDEAVTNAARQHVDAEKLDLIGRMEGGWYTRTRERFEMPAIALEDWKGKP